MTQVASCRDVYIIDKTASGFEIYLSGGAIGAGSDVPACVRDLRQDGNLEFLLDSGIGSITGKCSAAWTAIYAWTGGDYANVSDRFKDFYKQRLDALNKKIFALRPTRGPKESSYEPRDKECLQAEASKIERFLGISSEAGLDQAIRLANSKNPAQRSFAVDVLADVGTPNAQKYLQALARDSDGDVALTAKYCLSVLSEGANTGRARCV